MRYARGEHAAPHFDRELTRPSAEQADDERLAHTPDLYLLAIAQCATSADTGLVSYLFPARVHAVTPRPQDALLLPRPPPPPPLQPRHIPVWVSPTIAVPKQSSPFSAFSRTRSRMSRFRRAPQARQRHLRSLRNVRLAQYSLPRSRPLHLCWLPFTSTFLSLSSRRASRTRVHRGEYSSITVSRCCHAPDPLPLLDLLCNTRSSGILSPTRVAFLVPSPARAPPSRLGLLNSWSSAQNSLSSRAEQVMPVMPVMGPADR